MNKSRPFLLLIIVLFLLGFVFDSASQVLAQSLSANDVISAVNDLRASRGLVAYQVDSGLMSYAQQHADYMASIQSGTHTHSDGSIAWQSGIQENVASGTDGLMDSSFIVNQIWADDIHMRTMVGFTSGNVGAGVALGGDGNIYVSLNVIGGESSAAPQPVNVTTNVAPVPQSSPTSASEWIAPLVKSTPNAEGQIIHIVQNGQSLWDIAVAYEVTIDEIRGLNNLAMDSTVINVGQELFIMQVTVQPTIPTTDTPIPTVLVPTLRPSFTATRELLETEEMAVLVESPIVPTSIPPRQSQAGNQFNVVYVLVTLLLVGVLFFSFFKFFNIKEPSSETQNPDR